MPSADADRLIQINLPDGVRFDETETIKPLSEMVIEVAPPQPLRHLTAVMSELLGLSADDPASVVRSCLADLAAVKVEAADETLSQYLVGEPGEPTARLQETTDRARRNLIDLREGLDRLSSSPLETATPGALRDLWGQCHWIHGPLWRCSSADTLSPRAAVARAGMIEDVSHRAVPCSARIDVDVDVADAEFFSIARLAGVMSILLMTVVPAFFAFTASRHGQRGSTPSAEVLAGALTLFSAIQAGRIEPPDRSTLRGLLSSTGSWLIVASILPTVVLAVALAFNVSGWGPVKAASYAITAQVLLQVILQLLKWRAGRSRRPPRRRLSTAPAPDYGGYGILQSDWWRSTTADALKIGRAAYAYVIWEHDGMPSLSRLLGDARQAIPPPPSALTSARRFISWLSRPHSAPPAMSPDEGSSAEYASWRTPRGPSTVPIDDAIGMPPIPPNRPANILALLRSGTAAQAVTFVVFREEPTEEWVTRLAARRVDLDSDRLAPLENTTDIIDIFVSVPRDCEPPALECHPLVEVLAAAAEHHLTVLDAQLPVPSPSSAYTERIWARAQVGLHDGEIGRLPGFLRAVREHVAGNEVANSTGRPPCDVLVRSGPERPLRVIVSSSRTGPATESRLVLASGMDVVAAVTTPEAQREDSDAKNWRILALSASARIGIERDILDQLSKGSNEKQRLRLAGLTYAVLHGTAVIFILAHQPGRHDDPDPGLAGLQERRADVHLAVLINEWQSAQQLGQAKDEPLLTVRIHAEDRPGTLLDVLTSLNAALRANLQSPPDEQASVVWYALTRVTVGHATRLTARLAIDPREIEHWPDGKLHEIERATRLRAASKAASRRSVNPLDEALGAPEDTVISLDIVKAPAESQSPH